MKRLWLLMGLSLVCLCTWIPPGRDASAMSGREYSLAADYLANLFQCGRVVVLRILDQLDPERVRPEESTPEGPPKYKSLSPAIFGRLMADEFVTRTGVKIKQTSLGKGKKGPRNIYNKPDPWEEAQLNKFTSSSYPKSVGFGEFVKLEGSGPMVYRYMLPVYIEKACLKCHGNPATSPTGDGLDITGHEMEGYKEGELRGGISVTIPVDEKSIVFMYSEPTGR